MKRLNVQLSHCLAWTLLAVGLWPAPAGAQVHSETPLEVQSITGPFGVYVQPGRWSQRLAKVNNRSAVRREVRVSLQTSQAGGRSVLFGREFAVPAGCRRKALLAIQAGQTTIRKPGETGPVPPSRTLEQAYFLDDLTGGVNLGSHADLDRVMPADATAVALLVREFDTHDDYQYLMKALPPTRGLNDVRIAGLGRPEMPTEWYGYDLIDVVMTWGLDWNRVPPAAQRALLDWVARGGTLLVLGSPKTPELLSGQLAAAAGVGCTGYHRVTRLDIVERQADASPAGRDRPIDVQLKNPQTMIELVPAEAELLATANGLPLLTRRAYGNGTICVLAVSVGALVYEADPEVPEGSPPPETPAQRQARYERNRASAAVWQLVGRARLRSPVLDGTDFAEKASVTLSEIAGRRVPPRWMPLAALLAAMAVVAGVGAMLVWRGKGEWLWAGVVPVALLVAAGLAGPIWLNVLLGIVALAAAVALWMWIGWRGSLVAALALAGLVTGAVVRAAAVGQRSERLTYIGLLNQSPAGRSRADGVFAYATGTGTREVAFCSQGAETTLDRISGQAGAALAQSRVLLTAGGLCYPPQRLSDTTVKMSASGLARQAVLDADLRFGPEGLTGRVVNHAPVPVRRSVLYMHRNTYDVGTLQPGVNEIRLGPDAWLGSVTFPADDEGKPLPPRAEFIGGALTPDPQDIRRGRLVRELLSLPRQGRLPEPGPVLIGYAELPPQDLLAGAAEDRRGWSILTGAFRPGRAETGGEVLVPLGMADISLRGMPWMGYQQRFGPLEMDAQMAVSVRPPAGVGRLEEDAAVRLRFDASASGYDVIVSGLGPDGERTVIETLRDPIAVRVVSIPRAGRFFKDGAWRFHIRFDRRDQGPGGVITRSAVAARITAIDAGLEGTHLGQ